MKLIDKLELEALAFMEKRKHIEDKLKNESLDIINKLERDIYNHFRAQENISLSFLYNFINNDIAPLINSYRNEHEALMELAIRTNYEIGLQNGQKFLNLANEQINALGEIRNSNYEEVLVALLLYTSNLVDNLHNDLLGRLSKDTTSIYITNKNQGDYNSVDRDIDTNDNTVNTVLSGAIIARYINSTFNNIRNRAKLIAVNEVNRALNHGHLMRYMDSTVRQVKWIEVKDERLCANCRAAASGGEYRNGVYDITSINPPPLHPNCRCIIIPYNKAWESIIYQLSS